jgi:acyl-CoA synthetase (AMP-forming)/AMP-acid ligase II
MLVTIMAILKVGAAFVSLDPATPSARLKHMVQDSNIKLLIGQNETRESWSFLQD